MVYDGSFHPVDSSEICFKIAGAQALKKGLSEGNPILLEPIVKIRITVPNAFTGDILSDLNTKRARVQSMNPQVTSTHRGRSAHGEVLTLRHDLRSITHGRGTNQGVRPQRRVPSHITLRLSPNGSRSKPKPNSLSNYLQKSRVVSCSFFYMGAFTKRRGKGLCSPPAST
jgi:translation elongation factor EF-G